MKILKLESSNVLRLDAVEISPEGNTIIIGGKNGAGKTSVLDSIFLAMGGRAAKHQKPLKEGKKKGKIVLQLDDLTVTRTFTAGGGGSLIVANKDGARYPSPQSMLDKLTGRLTFDPLAWSNMDDNRQLSLLKEMVGLDFSELDKKRGTIYAERTFIGNEGKRLKAQMGDPDYPEDTPDEKIPAGELVAELEDIQKWNDATEDIKTALQTEKDIVNENLKTVSMLQTEEKEILEKIKDLNDGLAQLKETQETTAENIEVARGHIQEREVELEAREEKLEDEVREKIASLDEKNEAVARKKSYAEKMVLVNAKRDEYESRTKDIDAIDAEKGKALSETSFPIDALSFDEGGVLYNGIPFSQASSAEKLRVSVAMGFAMNPKLKVLLIRDGSLLDEDSMKMVAAMAKEADGQIWLEVVSTGKKCQIIIESGRVKGAKVKEEEEPTEKAAGDNNK